MLWRQQRKFTLEMGRLGSSTWDREKESRTIELYFGNIKIYWEYIRNTGLYLDKFKLEIEILERNFEWVASIHVKYLHIKRLKKKKKRNI